MRHLITPALMLAGLLVLAACGGSADQKEKPLTSLEPGTQTVSYAIGMDMAKQTSMMPGADDQEQVMAGLRDRFANNAKLDDTEAQIAMQPPGMGPQVADTDLAPFATAEARQSYAVGVVMASFASRQVEDLDDHALTQGMKDMYGGGATLLAEDQIQVVVQDYFQKQQEIKTAANRTEGQAFLAENASREGVTVTASGLQYEVLRDGDGPRPSADSTVKVHYRGTLLDGTQFDSSYDRGEPISFSLKGVIAGWTEGVQLMPVGSKYRLFIPDNLAYGERGAGNMIGPNATLIFDVELLEIQD